MINHKKLEFVFFISFIQWPLKFEIIYTASRKKTLLGNKILLMFLSRAYYSSLPILNHTGIQNSSISIVKMSTFNILVLRLMTMAFLLLQISLLYKSSCILICKTCGCKVWPTILNPKKHYKTETIYHVDYSTGSSYPKAHWDNTVGE